MEEKMYREDGTLVYVGETLYGKPYGVGTVYWPDGHIRQQGIFSIKGLIEGKIFYPNGKLRFEGKLSICYGYGSNYPIEGRLYSENGELIYDGEFRIEKSGLGYPFVVIPEEFGSCESVALKNVPAFMWEDVRRAQS